NKTAGYTQKEIDGLDNIVSAGFLDSFRYLHPDTIKYSWWSFRAGARAKNIGWRIDSFLCSEGLTKNIKSADILNEVEGSDHCPVMLELNVS
ncbi:MAG: exodeoxyribonuclease III, partial [Gammaproteobacteria bacterium]